MRKNLFFLIIAAMVLAFVPTACHKTPEPEPSTQDDPSKDSPASEDPTTSEDPSVEPSDITVVEAGEDIPYIDAALAETVGLVDLPALSPVIKVIQSISGLEPSFEALTEERLGDLTTYKFLEEDGRRTEINEIALGTEELKGKWTLTRDAEGNDILTWDYDESADGITLEFLDNEDKTCVLTLKGSGKTTAIPITERDHQWKTIDGVATDCYTYNIFLVLLPENLEIKLTRDGDTLVEGAIHDRISPESLEFLSMDNIMEGEIRDFELNGSVDGQLDVCGYVLSMDDIEFSFQGLNGIEEGNASLTGSIELSYKGDRMLRADIDNLSYDSSTLVDGKADVFIGSKLCAEVTANELMVEPETEPDDYSLYLADYLTIDLFYAAAPLSHERRSAELFIVPGSGDLPVEIAFASEGFETRYNVMEIATAENFPKTITAVAGIVGLLQIMFGGN